MSLYNRNWKEKNKKNKRTKEKNQKKIRGSGSGAVASCDSTSFSMVLQHSLPVETSIHVCTTMRHDVIIPYMYSERNDRTVTLTHTPTAVIKRSIVPFRMSYLTHNRQTRANMTDDNRKN